MKNFNRIAALMLALTLIFGMIPFFSAPASAATNSSVASQVSARLPIVTYAMPLSGASRVYSYSNSSLSSRTTGYYIDTFSDQIVITKISSDGRAVYVSYPSSSASSGYRSRWFATDDILGLASVSIKGYTATAKSTTYRMGSSSRVTSYGSIAKNDGCVMLGTHSVGGKTYYPTIYPISSGRYNNISGVKYKLAMATTAAPSGGNQGGNQSSSSSWQMPMKNAYCTWESKENWSWATYDNRKGDRDYHIGIDIYGTNGAVYAASAGKVVAASASNKGANGRYVIIQHTIGGKTVYSFYAHLASVHVSKGQNVTVKTQLGVAGGSGNGSNSNYKTHLHFAIVDTLWSGGGYWGYAPYFTGNKVKYDGVTFYNPIYVISKGKLP